MNRRIVFISKGYRGWLVIVTSPKASIGHLFYPIDIQDTAKSRTGCVDNRHLRWFVESIFVNVGGLLAEASSLPMKQVSVGGVIVVRGRESILQGKGRQFVGIPKHSNQM